MPTRIVRASFLIALAVAVTAAAVWLAAEAQRRAASRWATQARTAQTMLTAMLDQDSGLRGYSLSGDATALGDYAAGYSRFETAAAAARTHAGSDRASIHAIDAQRGLDARWRLLAARQIRLVRARGPGHPAIAQALARKRLLDAFRAANDRLQEAVAHRGSAAQRRAALETVAIIVLLSVFFAAVGYVTLLRPARRDAAARAEEDRYNRTQTELVDRLQAARSEDDARRLLERHVERTIPGSSVYVFDPFDGAAAAPDHSLFAERRPLLARGEVIGSVLVHHDDPLSAQQARRLDDSIRQAAPVLANLRDLAIAETRAATDPLTGLANRRALEDTMRRMLAQASRTIRPLAVLAVDLDHFKRVNDAFGHEQGDSVLAAVGDALGSTVRSSDFVARYGGEEFIVLAPDTDAAGGAIVAEKLRRAIARISLPSDGGTISGSVGVASFPDHGGDAEVLLRIADRALYAAKEAGRDRVEVAGQGSVVGAP